MIFLIDGSDFSVFVVFSNKSIAALSKACAAWVTTVTPSKTLAVSKGFGALVKNDQLIQYMVFDAMEKYRPGGLFFVLLTVDTVGYTDVRISDIRKIYVLFHKRLMAKESVFDFLDRKLLDFSNHYYAPKTVTSFSSRRFHTSSELTQ